MARCCKFTVTGRGCCTTVVLLTAVCVAALVCPAAALQKRQHPKTRPRLSMIQETHQTPSFYLRCGQHKLKPHQHKSPEDQAREAELEAGLGRRLQAKMAKPSPVLKGVTIQTYFWVIYSGAKTVDNGYVPMTQINAQMKVLNTAYNNDMIAVKFKLAQVKYINNTAWTQCPPLSPCEAAMKQACRKGKLANNQALHIYSTDPYDGLGYTWFPSGSIDYKDGVVFLWQTLPGGSYSYANQGYTLVHEVGHWFGLEHTFNGDPQGCTQGDVVSDTPYEATANGGCQSVPPRDTCPKLPGLDPINNFMDYSSDACMTNFTALQAARAASQWKLYRAAAAG